MSECYFDPAMQKHKERMQKVYRSRQRRELIRKHWDLLAIGFAAIAGSVSLVIWKIFL